MRCAPAASADRKRVLPVWKENYGAGLLTKTLRADIFV